MSYQQFINDPHYQRLLQQVLQPNIESAVAEKVKKERAHEKIREAKNAWFFPGYERKKENILDTGNVIHPRTIHIGETEDHVLPTWAVPIADADKLNNAKGVAEASEKYDKTIDAFYPEFQEDAQNYLKAAEAGIMTTQDFGPIKLVFTLQELLNIEQRVFTLPDAVQTKQTNMLNIMVAEYNRFQISEDLGELDTVEARKGQYSTTQYSLRKAAGHISWSDEFSMQNYLENPMPIAMQNVASDMIRVKSKKIATVLATASAVANSTTLTAMTGEHSTLNPYTLFTTAIKQIWDNFGTAQNIAMSQITLNNFLSNTWVKPLTQAPQTIAPTQGTFTLPGGLGLTAYIDNSLADNVVYIWDPEAIWFLQGPVRAASYRDEIPGGSGYIVRDWHKCIVRKSGMIRQIASL